MMGCVHLVNAEWPVTSSIASPLLPHSVCHEESLIWFLSTKPIIKDIMILYKNGNTYIPFIRCVGD